MTITRARDGSRIGNGKDNIVGTKQNDVINGLGGSDIINGGGGNDTICGDDGDDSLFGGGGSNDVLYGDLGDDTMNGGPNGGSVFGGGSPPGGVGDTATYSKMPGQSGLDVDANLDTGLVNSSWGYDQLNGIENVKGSPGNDYLTGDAFSNALYGGDGKDTVVGMGGNDEVSGGGGDDFLVGNSGQDVIDGGNNSAVGTTWEEPGDVVWYDQSPGAVVVNLGTGGCGPCAQDGFGYQDALVRVDSAVGSYSAGSILDGDDGGNILQGGDYGDTLVGSGGNDVLIGQGGNDSLYGDAGVDPGYAGLGVDACTSVAIYLASSCEGSSNPD